MSRVNLADPDRQTTDTIFVFFLGRHIAERLSASLNTSIIGILELSKSLLSTLSSIFARTFMNGQIISLRKITKFIKKIIFAFKNYHYKKEIRKFVEILFLI